ncbi:MAG: hypothetical protein M5R36_28960 [Deltaproteobacteria bacterium]|nr:hypothetical protein [Deltaproteobacteria bacterium]
MTDVQQASQQPLPGEPASRRFRRDIFSNNINALIKTDRLDCTHLSLLPEPPDEVRLVPSRTNDFAVAVGNNFLTSRFDPGKEAEGLVEKARARVGNVPRTVCVLGSAGGYLAHAALRAGCAEVLVYDPDPRVLAATLGTIDFTGDIETGRLRFFADPASIYFAPRYRVRMEPDVDILVLPNYAKTYPDAAAALTDRVAVIIRDTDILSQTVATKTRAWFDDAFGNLPAFFVLAVDRDALRTVPRRAVRDRLGGSFARQERPAARRLSRPRRDRFGGDGAAKTRRGRRRPRISRWRSRATTSPGSSPAFPFSTRSQSRST